LNQVKKRLALAQPGERIVYYVGDLARDRANSADLSELADYVLAASSAGRLLLGQRRLGPGQFEYRATALPPRGQILVDIKRRRRVPAGGATQ
jgi:hypothetical protein